MGAHNVKLWHSAPRLHPMTRSSESNRAMGVKGHLSFPSASSAAGARGRAPGDLLSIALPLPRAVCTLPFPCSRAGRGASANPPRPGEL